MRAVAAASAWVDGRAADVAFLAALATGNAAHFTTMQVRGRAVQGLGLHLARLDAANRELAGSGLDGVGVRETCIAALDAAGADDATLRVTAAVDDGTLLVSLAPPMDAGTGRLRLRAFAHVRAFAHLKHAGLFAQGHYRRLARAAGADDALFTMPDGAVAEGAMWNLALWDGARVVWPEAPALRGTREALLQRHFAGTGVAQVRCPVSLAALPALAGIACNARGVQGIAAVDGVAMADPGPLLALATTAAAATPWEPLGGPVALPGVAPTIDRGPPL
jgi:branched-subunit amino acid aminotransferase/4-amino-4-deoxychorismate lyase